ncbi:cytochrome P450 [Exidia glandulosa HHB12029]|uniref:Cytochrome P450 n=1 Tax=Exidia glandulosa HHB12029 TaxID=1314781 RepID=A0A165MMC3_EXIGL|nr:cytochrome P450 [Exidia glandulosa HHB12029]
MYSLTDNALGQQLSQYLSSLPKTYDWYTVGTGLAAVYAASKVAKAVYNLYLSPLASIPGPRFAAVSDWWLEWNALNFRRTPSIHEAFLKYGPIVRIGPTKVALANAEDVHEIYRTHEYRKSPWYRFFTFGGQSNMVHTKDPALHNLLRRCSAPAFRGDSLRAASAGLGEEMQDVVTRIKRDTADGSAIDVLHFFRLISLDVLGITVLGTRFDQMKTGQNHPVTEYLDDWFLDKAIANYLPPIAYNALKLVPSKKIQRIFTGDANMVNMAGQLYDSSSGNPEDGDVISLCKSYKDPATGQGISRGQVIGEVATFLGAGTDPTSVALAYIAYNIARDETFAKELRAELAMLPDHVIYDIDVLKELPYLNAYIKEVMRVHGPAPTFFERIVPEQGAYLSGHFLPGGTIVGGQSWTSHRDPKLFPEPMKIDPGRWIERTATGWKNREDVSPEMQAAYFPFMQGIRACAGRPLAEMEIILVTSTLVRNFRIKLDEKTTPESMAPRDLAVVGPAAQRCLLHFEHNPL